MRRQDIFSAIALLVLTTSPRIVLGQANQAVMIAQQISSGPAYTYIQSTTGRAANASAVAYGTNIGNAHLLIASAVLESSSATVSTLVDTKLNTFAFVRRDSSSSPAGTIETWWACSGSAGADTVTASTASAGVVVDLSISEYSGVCTVDKNQGTGTGTATSFTTSGVTATTTAANELIYGFAFSSGGITAGAGFTRRENFANLVFQITEDRSVNSVGTYAATTSTVFGSIQVVTFKP